MCCRLFDLIENCAREHMSSVTQKKLNQEEMIVEAGLLSAFNAVVQQSSEKIYLVRCGVINTKQNRLFLCRQQFALPITIDG